MDLRLGIDWGKLVIGVWIRFICLKGFYWCYYVDVCFFEEFGVFRVVMGEFERLVIVRVILFYNLEI